MGMGAFGRTGLILGLALLVGAVFSPSSFVLAAQWSDFTHRGNTHGWLILLVCVALVLRERQVLSACAAHSSLPALMALATCVVLWLAAYRASIQSLHLALLPIIFWLTVTAALGGCVGRVILFATVFFGFAEPPLSLLGAPLQWLAVQAVPWLLRLTGPLAVIAGNFIRIPNGTFEIQEGCSGAHYMIVGLAVAALHGELRRDPWRTRVSQLALMALLALLANWARIYFIVEAGYLSNMHSSLLKEHYTFGWLVFAVAVAGFFLIRWRLDPALPPAPNDVHLTGADIRHGWAADLARVAPVVLVVIALPALSAIARSARPPAADIRPPLPRPPWQVLPQARSISWLPEFAGADWHEHLIFSNGDSTVETFAVLYRAQRQGAKLHDRDNTLLGPQLTARGSRPTVQHFREQEAQDSAPPYTWSLVWYRYEIVGAVFDSPVAAQLWYGMRATVSQPTAVMVALRALCVPDCGAARRNLKDFTASVTLP